MRSIKTRNALNYDTDQASQATAFTNHLPSLTQQQFKDECDINNIVRQFGITGQLPTSVYLPTYEDFSEISDFQSALHVIQRAEASFAAMPAHVRERFQNNPQKFLDFTSDTRNAEEARSLGLFRDAPPIPPTLPSPVNATPLAPPSASGAPIPA